MKFRKKPIVVDLMRYSGSPNEQIPGVRHRPDGSAFVENERLHTSDLELKPGDYINVSTPGNYFSIPADVVAEMYEPVE